MWIRSQDKRILINAKAVCTTNGVIYADDDIDTYLIGDYDTEEAIKVVDEIHSIIASDGELNDCTFRVYQMPKKREVK